MTLESAIEQEVAAWAEGRGWLTRRIEYIGRRGCPDHIFIGFGQAVFIEFKQPNGTLSALQKRERKHWDDRGVKIHVFDNAVEAKSLLLNLELES